MSFLIRTAVFVRFFMLCTPPGIQVARLPKACYNTEAGATSGIRILLLVTARRCIVPLPGTFFLTGCAKLQNSLYYKRSGGCSPVLCMIPPTFLLGRFDGWQRPPRLGTAEGAFALPSAGDGWRGLCVYKTRSTINASFCSTLNKPGGQSSELPRG